MKQRVFRVVPAMYVKWALYERRWFLGVIPYWYDLYHFSNSYEDIEKAVKQMNGRLV